MGRMPRSTIHCPDSLLDIRGRRAIFRAMSRKQLLEYATRFHGHLGPWLVLGLRAGRRAARVLKATPFQLEAVVHCPARTPYSCFLDGIQLGSGCTLGKGNIRHIRSSRVRVEFSRFAVTGERMHSKQTKAKASLLLELNPEVWTELNLQSVRTRAKVEALGRNIARRPLRTLFVETRTS